VSLSSLQDGSIVRIPAHSDFGSLTLLFQDEVGGLEVARWGAGIAMKTPSAEFERRGDFVPVTPRPGTVVVNAGYLLMRWSNGRWRNAVHRVLGPPETRNKDGTDLAPERYSVAFFASPDPESEIDALPGCWGENVPKRWKPMNAGDYLQRKRKIAYA
jgi:isopenicillin N synthase-like dioxygenase